MRSSFEQGRARSCCCCCTLAQIFPRELTQLFTFPLLQGAPEEWARKNFAGCPVGESRRRRRAVKIAARMAQRPGRSIPQRFDSFYAVKAADTFFDRAETAPDRLQAVHRRKAREQLGVAGRTYLLLEDTSELSWPGNQPLPVLGPVGAGAEGLQGFLLHSTLAVAWPREAALKYGCRWLIEEFHKCLKSGMGAERLQLETAARLFAAIALMSVVALRLIDLREHVRRQPQAPAAQAGLSALERSVLSQRLGRPLTTVRDVALALGRLGGHINRKRDGPPGWQTLWRGMNELRVLVQGYRLAQQASEFGL